MKLSVPNQLGSVGVNVQAPVAGSMAAVPCVAGVVTLKMVPSVKPSASVAVNVPLPTSPSLPV